MGFTESVSTVLKKYAVFTGRASRSEFWWFVLFNFLASAVGSILDQAANTGAISLIVSLVLFLPSLAVGVRRLHDIDRSGWWLLISIIPLIGWIVLIYWNVQPSQPGDNRFGPPPALTA